MSEVAMPRRLVERLEDCAEREDFARLLRELGADANGDMNGDADRDVNGDVNGDAAVPGLDAEANQILVRRYFEMWNTGDRTEADAVLGPTYLDHAHPSVMGPAAVRSLVRRFRRENPDAQMAAEIVAFDADYVIARRAIRWSSRRTMEPCGVALFRVTGGQLAEQWSCSPTAKRESSRPERLFALGNYF